MTEMEKWDKQGDQISAVAEFLEYLESHGYVIAEYLDVGTFGDEPIQQLCPTGMGTEKMICRSFGIDPRLLEEERRALLESISKAG